MNQFLNISIGAYTDKGKKEVNQDFHGERIPNLTERKIKGIAIAVADGISSSTVSQIASQVAVTRFLHDYYATSDAWTVKHAVTKILHATNSALYAKSRRSEHRSDLNKGYVTTFAGIVLKGNYAHLIHIGDTRIYRIRTNGLEQLTVDHRIRISESECYLSRAIGISDSCEFEYKMLPLEAGDSFLIATDGVYEFIDTGTVNEILIAATDLVQAAQSIVTHALENGSDDNLTVQILKVNALVQHSNTKDILQSNVVSLPPILAEGDCFDGYRIIETLKESNRSHVYRAEHLETKESVVIKLPSLDLRDDPKYIEQFLSEEWIARRINNPHVMKASLLSRERKFVYTVMEYIEGQTLAQWIIDNPKPSLTDVRHVVSQIVKGLQAFHRMDMLYQDLKPDNIVINNDGMVKIIDFGAVRVAGLEELVGEFHQNRIAGTALYTAPEYFLGEQGTPQSDIYSLGVLTYFMLSGEYPYHLSVARATTVAAQRRLKYRSVLNEHWEIPSWIDSTLEKSVAINPYKRYDALSEFIYDLHHPNQAFIHKSRPPLLERNPAAFWKGISLVLGLLCLYLLWCRS